MKNLSDAQIIKKYRAVLSDLKALQRLDDRFAAQVQQSKNSETQK